MDRKTLLFYINAIHEGGAERVILRLANHFSQVGYRSIVVTSFVDDNEYPVPDGVERISIEREEIKQSKLKRNISRIIALRKICKSVRAEAIISFMCEPIFRSICATVGLPIKRIVSVRNDPKVEYSGKVGHFVGKYMLPWADGCVFQTEEAQAWFPKRLQNKSKVIFNEVDKVFFAAEYVGGNDIVTLGRLNKQKNQLMLIRAFARIADEFPNRHLCIYGIGDQKEFLQNEISRLQMEHAIKLMGMTTNSADILAHAGLFVLSSDYEGMPNALMEALAVGVPCISTDCPCGGPRTLIQNGANGLLVPVNDEDAMSEAMKALLSDNNHACALGKNAKTMARSFAPDAVFQEWKNYVEKVIKHGH